MNSSIRIFWGVCILALSSCSTNSSLRNAVTNRPYDLAAKPLRVEATAFSQQGTTTLYLRINRSQLLYTRETPSSPFTSEVSISIDTLTFLSNDTLKTDSPQWMNLEFNFPSLNSNEYFSFELQDINRNVSERLYVEPNEYLVWDVESDKAINPTNVEIGTKILIQSPGVESWEVYKAHPPKTLPSPPFSGSKNPIDTVVARPFAFSNGNWVVTDGCQFFFNDKTKRSIVINGRKSDFPKSINVEDLLESTRYIATRNEYSKLMNAEHPKKSLDEFWLKCGGSFSKSRRLIEIYYDRVEEANTFFSGLQEGWRTDRGMIHIVMGVPDKVRSTSFSEVWTYGEEDTPNFIAFIFEKREHVLDDNHFILIRGVTYKNNWDRVVTSWRNGRVQGD